MNRAGECLRYDESGAAIIEMLFVIPIVVLFAAAILDFSILIKSSTALDSAATAAIRYCMDDPGQIRNEHDIKAYLEVIEPSLTGVEVQLTEGSIRKETYDHLFYIDETDTAIPRRSYCSTQPLTLELTYKGQFKTPVGKGISLACGADGSLIVHNEKTGSLDKTDGDTW